MQLREPSVSGLPMVHPSLLWAVLQTGGKKWGNSSIPMYMNSIFLPIVEGCNGYRPRAWKYFLQHTLATPIDLTVTVAHYPCGASNYNRITYYNRTLAKNQMNLLRSSKKSTSRLDQATADIKRCQKPSQRPTELLQSSAVSGSIVESLETCSPCLPENISLSNSAV